MIALSFIGTFAYAQTAPPADSRGPEGASEIIEVDFETGMYIEKDMMLHGLRGYASVDFKQPRGWEMISDPELHLFFEHSEALLADQSNLTVLLNDVPISTVALASENVQNGHLIAKLPLDSIEPYNRITFAGTHRKTEQCQDPYDMALWTRISKGSKLRFEVVESNVRGELLEYPYPLFDDNGFGPVELTWITGPSVSDETLTAVSTVGFGLGRISDYRGVKMMPAVPDLSLATTHALLIGTPEEQPLIADLVDLSEVGKVKGLIAVVPNPYDPKLAVLVVTGFNVTDVITAAQALSANPRYQRFAGEVALVQRVGDTRPPPTRQVPRPLSGDDVTLADVGMKDRTVRGYYAPQFRIPIFLEGDAAVTPSGGVARIEYGYSAGLDTSLSTLEVRLNGVTLRSVPLDYSSGEALTSLRVRLPSEMVSPHSYLDAVFHLFPEGYDSCEWHPDETHWATLYASSEVRIPHDNYAQLPDLGRLRYRGWPFNLEAGPVQLVVADEPSGDEISAVFAFAARLGAWSIQDQPELSVSTATAAGRTRVLEHRVLLVSDRPHAWFNALVAENVLSPPGDIGDMGASQFRGGGLRYIEQRLHPRSIDKAVMVMRGNDALGLNELVSALSEGRTLSKLDRNLALFTGSGRIQTTKTEDARRVGNVPQFTQAQLTIQRYWAPWGIISVVGALLFAFVVARWARRRGGEV